MWCNYLRIPKRHLLHRWRAPRCYTIKLHNVLKHHLYIGNHMSGKLVFILKWGHSFSHFDHGRSKLTMHDIHSLPVWHVVPTQPATQSQSNRLVPWLLRQVPPFVQGLLLHSFTSGEIIDGVMQGNRNRWRRQSQYLVALLFDIIMIVSLWKSTDISVSTAAKDPVKLQTDWKYSNPNLRNCET